MRKPTIPLVNLERHHAALSDEFLTLAKDLFTKGAFVGGEKVAEFEAAFATYTGANHCIAVGNGTDALWLALRALGVGEGDEVITTAVSFFATAEAICLAGATPVFCDIDPETANLDVAQLPTKLTPRTKAIMPVHLYGSTSGFEDVVEFASRHSLFLVEDCAQAAGARIAGRHVGTFGDAGCFSFYPSKNLSAAGDGGAIVCNSSSLEDRCRRLANHGGVEKYEHTILGTNSRLDALQAGILSIKLPHLDDWNRQRSASAALYRKLLANQPVELLEGGSTESHVNHLFVIRVSDRDRVLSHLRANGVLADIHYPYVLPALPVYDSGTSPLSEYPVADRHARTAISLPIFPGMHDSEIERVVEVLLPAVRGEI